MLFANRQPQSRELIERLLKRLNCYGLTTAELGSRFELIIYLQRAFSERKTDSLEESLGTFRTHVRGNRFDSIRTTALGNNLRHEWRDEFGYYWRATRKARELRTEIETIPELIESVPDISEPTQGDRGVQAISPPLRSVDAKA